MFENSPTLQRWVEGVTLSKSRRDGRIPVAFLSRPFGTIPFRLSIPTLKRWAIVECPSGTRDVVVFDFPVRSNLRRLPVHQQHSSAPLELRVAASRNAHTPNRDIVSAASRR